MIPKNSEINIEIEDQAGLTYNIEDDTNISGAIDKRESVKQAIYLALNIERYQYLIYSWNYGFEVNDLIGRSRGYVYPELKRRIKEALLQDDRITNVTNFSISSQGDEVSVKFTAETIYGDIPGEVIRNV